MVNLRETLRAVRKTITNRIERKVVGMIRRSTISSQDHSKNLPLATAGSVANVTAALVEQFQQYGIASHAPDGAEGILLQVAGDPGHVVLVVVSDRATRPKNLAPLESALYSAAGGIVKCDAAGKVNISGDQLVPGLLPVARVTSTLTTALAFDAWALLVEGFINGVAPGTFTPANNMAFIKASNGLGTVASGSGDADIT